MNFGELWAQFVSLFANGLESLAGLFSFLGAHQWAAAIVVLTLIVRTLLLPLAVKQIRGMQAMQRLQPEMKRLQQKYRNDRQRLNQELMELYRREGASPLGGCLPMLPQAPVLFAMFYAIRGLSSRDLAMPFLGLGDLTQPTNSSIAGWLLLIVYTGLTFLSTRQLSAATNRQQQRIQQLMPLFFVFIMLGFPAGLVLYWTTQQAYQFVQQTLMLRGKRLEPPDKATGKGPPAQPLPKPKQSKGIKPRRQR